MSSSRGRLVQRVSLLVGLVAAILIFRLALEWYRTIDNINAMIVTPVALPATPVATGDGAPVVTDMATDQVTAFSTGPADESAHAGFTMQAAPTRAATASDSTLPRTLNILLLGTDARNGDTAATRTDALVLVHIDRERQTASMLSLPRDLWVDYSGGGEGRINAAYPLGESRFGPGGGPAMIKATVGELLDLEIDYFVMVNFEGFRTLIDRIGGITVDVPYAIDDPAYPTEDYKTIAISFRPGPQRMSGQRALMYARTRHADSDFGRNQRQQQVLLAIFDRVRERGLLQQLTSLDDYTGALRDYVRTDIPRSMLFELAQWGRNLDPHSIDRYAIDSSMVVMLRNPATFAAEPRALQRVVAKFTGQPQPSASDPQPAGRGD